MTDAAKKFFFDQRKSAASETHENVQKWQADRRNNRIKFQEKTRVNTQKAKGIEIASRGSRKKLAEQRGAEAAELRAQKKSLQDSYRAQQESHMQVVKEVVNATASDKFAAPANARHMLQHPHYQEVCGTRFSLSSSKC